MLSTKFDAQLVKFASKTGPIVSDNNRRDSKAIDYALHEEFYGVSCGRFLTWHGLAPLGESFRHGDHMLVPSWSDGKTDNEIQEDELEGD